MVLQIYLLLFSAYKRNEGYGNTGHSKPWPLHGLSTLCKPLWDCDGLVVAAFCPSWFLVVCFDVKYHGLKTLALMQSSLASAVSVKPRW